MSETSTITKPLCDAINRLGGWAWRNNSGTMPATYNGKARFIKMGVTGSPDILGALSNGQLFGIETKLPGKKQSESQIDWEIKATARGVRYAVATDWQQGVALWQLWEEECRSSKSISTECTNCVHSASNGAPPSKGESAPSATRDYVRDTLPSPPVLPRPRSKRDTLRSR